MPSKKGRTSGTKKTPLSLKKVVLFNSGVGYFQREGRVSGSGEVTLRFRTSQVDDVLKSLSLLDLDGGRVSVVSFAGNEPISRILSSFSVDLGNNPPLAGICEQLRGSEVTVTVGTDQFQGVIMGVETRDHVVEKERLPVSYLHLLTDSEGIMSFPMEKLDSLKLMDDRLAAEVSKALEAIADNSRKDDRPVTINFCGKGKRRLVAGYVLETPVWKTSYRLVLDAEDKPFLQGWAIVENTQDEDWEDIKLSLVSGLPISFVQDLYNPLYLDRPRYEPPLRPGVGPRSYEGAVRDMRKPDEIAMLKARKPSAPKRMRQLREATIAAPPPMEFMDESETVAMDGLEAPRQSAGVEACVQAASVGELFEYAIEDTVSIKRRCSAMIPIVNLVMEGKKVSIYNEEVRRENPLNGVLLRNTCGLHLESGPVTVFDSGSYGGDALLGYTSPGERKLLSYAVDLTCLVDPGPESSTERIQMIKIVNGTLETVNKARSTKVYTLNNKSDKEKTLILEYPVRHGWELKAPKDADQPGTLEERTDRYYRFRIPLEAHQTVDFTVAEENVYPSVLYLTDQSLYQLEFFIRHKRASDKLKKTLKQVAEYRKNQEAVQREIEVLEERESSITDDQERIRENMTAVDTGSKLYKRYMDTLYKQEDELEKTRSEAEKKQSQLEQKRRELEDFLAGLSVE